MVYLSFLAAVAICAAAHFSDAAVMTYDGDKGYGKRPPKLGQVTSCTLKPKGRKLGDPVKPVAPGTCDPAALVKQLPDKLKELVDKKIKSTTDVEQQCFFTSDDLFAIGLEQYTEAKNLLGDKKTKVCLWSGLTSENAIAYVDDISECIRLENTPFGYFMETNFNLKTKNFPPNSLPCHKETNWDKGLVKWPGLKFDGMHLLRALWMFASRGIASRIDSDLTVLLNAAGNWKNNLSGDIFASIEFPVVLMNGKIKSVTVRLVTDTKDKDDKGKVRPAQFKCDSPQVLAFRATAAKDLGLKETDIKCETKTI